MTRINFTFSSEHITTMAGSYKNAVYLLCTPCCKLTTDAILLYLVKSFKIKTFPDGMYIAFLLVCI